MAGYDYLRVSDGTGDAALMHVEANRSVGSATLDVDTTSGVPAKFVATSGTLGPDGFITEATKCEFRAHLDSGNILIDGYEPGSHDIGHTEGQIVIIKPNTSWADRVATFIANVTGYGSGENGFFQDLAARFINATSLTTTNDVTVGANAHVVGNLDITGTSRLASATITTPPTTGATANQIIPTKQFYTVNALAAAATIKTPNYAPADGMTGVIRIRDNGTAQGLSWDGGWAAIGVTLPTATPGGSKNIFVSYVYIGEGAFCVLSVNRQA